MCEADPDRLNAFRSVLTSRASTHDLIVDALGRVLLETDMALQLFNDTSAHELNWIEPHLQKVFDEVNAVMLRITD